MSLIDKTASRPFIATFDSRLRSAGTNSSFVSQPIDLGINNYNSVCVLQASIPKSFYNMPSPFNTFILRENGIDTTIVIPEGNYTKLNLSTTLSSLLTTNSSQGWTYVVSYPNYTLVDNFKYTFTVSGNGGNQPSLIFSEGTPNRQLGFDENTTNTFSSDVLISTNAVNLAYILRMYIATDLVENADNSYLQEILNVGGTAPQGIINYVNYDIQFNSKDYNRSGSTSWRFTLLDDYGQVVDLNGVNWVFTVVFYTRSNTDEILRTDLMIRNEERLFNIQNQQENIRQEIGNIPTGQLGAETDIAEPPTILQPAGTVVLEQFLPSLEFIQP